ncbi:MAG: hypothetical protein ACYDCG_02635 [Candidatus Acidiferrales bacterium]
MYLLLAFYLFYAILILLLPGEAFMETQKLKIKVGEHEFEAEGPIDVVQAQFAAWKELIVNAPLKANELAAKTERPNEKTAPQLPHLALDRIMKVEGRVVSLTARAETLDETALLILLGQKELRGNQEVTGSEIMDGLRQSGYAIPRADTLMDRLSADGNVITVGVHRSRRYRLSNSGLNLALTVAQAVLQTVP